MNKLGRLEDVLEEFGIESAKELKARLQSESQLAKAGYELALENEELTKQLSKAIVPKLKTQEHIYSFDFNEIREYIVFAYMDNDRTLCENRDTGCLEVCNNQFLAKTLEEAQAKLNEIRRKFYGKD